MKTTKIPVILDTDIGGDIDDTWALAMLLGCPELDLKLLVTEHGDTTYRAKIAGKFLEIAGRADVPLGVGVASPMSSGYFQEPWVADYELDTYPGAVYADGVQALIDLVMSSAEPVTIIAIGVVTNLAEALRREPQIAGKCRFVGMHGSIRVGYDGSSEPSPEANVKNDVESLRVVFSAPWLEKIITPLDTCGMIVLAGDLYQKIFQHQSPVLKAVIENYRIWAGLVNWMTVDHFRTKSSTLFDTVAIYLAYSQALVGMEEVSLRITDEGLTVEDEAGDTVHAGMQWLDLDAFYHHLTVRLLAAGGETE